MGEVIDGFEGGPVAVEDVHHGLIGVGDIDLTRRINNDAQGPDELAVARAVGPEAPLVRSVQIEDLDLGPCRHAVAPVIKCREIGDVELAVALIDGKALGRVELPVCCFSPAAEGERRGPVLLIDLDEIGLVVRNIDEAVLADDDGGGYLELVVSCAELIGEGEIGIVDIYAARAAVADVDLAIVVHGNADRTFLAVERTQEFSVPVKNQDAVFHPRLGHVEVSL